MTKITKHHKKIIEFKGTKENDITSKRAMCLQTIRLHYGCLVKFLEDIELEIKD